MSESGGISVRRVRFVSTVTFFLRELVSRKPTVTTPQAQAHLSVAIYNAITIRARVECDCVSHSRPSATGHQGFADLALGQAHRTARTVPPKVSPHRSLAIACVAPGWWLPISWAVPHLKRNTVASCTSTQIKWRVPPPVSS